MINALHLLPVSELPVTAPPLCFLATSISEVGYASRLVDHCSSLHLLNRDHEMMAACAGLASTSSDLTVLVCQRRVNHLSSFATSQDRYFPFILFLQPQPVFMSLIYFVLLSLIVTIFCMGNVQLCMVGS